MSSLVRRIRKRMLKKAGYHREGAYKWAIGQDGKPYQQFIPKAERQILNPLGVPVGLHYPR